MAETTMELKDPKGRPIVPGARIRTGADEGTVGRLEPTYGVLTMIVEGGRTGKSERMVRASAVEVIQETD